MITGIVILLFIFVFLFDFKPILKNGEKKEKIVHGTIMVLSFTALILYSFDIYVPSPTIPIKNMIHILFGV